MPDDAVTVDYMLEPCWIVGDLSECANRLDQGYDEVSGFGYVLTTTLDPDHHGLEQTSLKLLPEVPCQNRRPQAVVELPGTRKPSRSVELEVRRSCTHRLRILVTEPSRAVCLG
jgi:hypothetical protein